METSGEFSFASRSKSDLIFILSKVAKVAFGLPPKELNMLVMGRFK